MMSTTLVPLNLGAGAVAISSPEQERIAKQFSQALGKSVPKLSFSGSRFHVRDGTGTKRTAETLTLDVVVVKVRNEDNRAFWNKAYSNDEALGPPDCYSTNGVTPTGPIEGRPVIKIADGTTRPTRSCAECPKNQAGSANDGTTRKACHWGKRAVAYLADDVGGQPYLIQLGAMSYSDKLGAVNANVPRGFKNYAQFLLSHGLNPTVVVTRMSFDTGATVPVVRFAVATDKNGSAIGLSEEGQKQMAVLYDSVEVNDLLDSAEGDVVADAASDTPTAPATPTPPVAPNGRPQLGANAELVELLAKLKEVDPEAFKEGEEWATHPGTDITEALDWVREAISAAAPPPPPPAPAPAEPVAPKRPTRRAKAETTTPVAAPTASGGGGVKSMLGLDQDDL